MFSLLFNGLVAGGKGWVERDDEGNEMVSMRVLSRLEKGKMVWPEWAVMGAVMVGEKD